VAGGCAEDKRPADGETIDTLRAEAFDRDEAARRGMGFEHLDHLA